MQFEADPQKDEINRAKHGVSFAQARTLWAQPGVQADLGIVNGEYRYARLGKLAGRVHIVIFTYRAGPAVRLISARPATPKEARYYETHRQK